MARKRKLGALPKTKLTSIASSKKARHLDGALRAQMSCNEDKAKLARDNALEMAERLSRMPRKKWVNYGWSSQTGGAWVEDNSHSSF